MKRPNLQRIILWNIIVIMIFGCYLRVNAEVIRGIVRDSLTTEGIPYASITYDGTTNRIVADNRGIFEVNVPGDTLLLTISSQGYSKKTINLKRNSFNLYDIYLTPEAVELSEVVVRKKKYSKKNNPAVEFAKRLKASGKETDPHTEPFYSYNRYQRISMGLHKFQYDSAGALERRFPFLKEHIDISPLTGEPVLTLSVKETASKIYNRRDPRKAVEEITGQRSQGIDEIVDVANMQTILGDMFGEIDLYDSQISLLQNRFVSPLSAIAPDFYRFYLTDTVMIDSVPCIALAFYPREKTSVGFSGHVYVEFDESKPLLIRKVDMHTDARIGLNFINNLNITQTFEEKNNKRMKTSDVLEIVVEPIPGKGQIDLRRSIALTDHSFEAVPDSVFATLGSTVEAAGFEDRDSCFWDDRRTISLQSSEENIGELMENLRKNKVYFWSEKLLKILFQGYIPTAKKSQFDIGPVNTIASYNSLEGLRLRAGGMTTANLSPHWFGRGYVAYGFRDHKWKYSVEAEYSFNKKKYHSREFPMHALRLTHRYDVDRLGAKYLSTNADNFVLSWQRMPNRRYTYARTTRLEYILELENNLSFNVSAENQRQEATEYLPFITYSGKHPGHYTENVFGFTIRFAPGEKFFQAKSYRVDINGDAPVFTLSHKFASKGLGSRYSLNRTEFEFSKRFWLSFLGSLETSVGAGHIWSSTPFPELFIPNANLSYTIRPKSFALLNPMEFINSSYVSWDLTYQLRGLILGRLPLIRKLGLREVVGFRGLYGRLDRRNKPSDEHPELLIFPEDAGRNGMPHGPYMEMAVGLENILRVLRVDYVWRLSYRHPGYPADRSGVRIAINVTF